MLQVLAHANLAHQLILVPIHASQLANVCEHELQAVGELERVDVAEAVLDVRVDDELGQAQDLAAQMERVSEAGLFALLGCERLDRLQVHVVVEVEVVQVFAVNQQVQHVVALSTDLETGLDPVDRRRLEELGVFELAEQVLFGLRFGVLCVQAVQDVALEL